MTRENKLYTRRSIVRLLAIDGEILDRLEELQIVIPLRRPGRERAYFADDVDRIRVYSVLTRDLDVNQAGAEIILRMRSRMLSVRERMARLLYEARAHGLLDDLQDLIELMDQEEV